MRLNSEVFPFYERCSLVPHVNAEITGIIVVAKVINYLQLDVKDLERAKSEVRWLFASADHYLKICEGVLDPTIQISVDVPHEIEESNGSSNKLVSDVLQDEYHMQIIEERMECLITQINIHLTNLTIKVAEEARVGLRETEFAKIPLLNAIKSQRQAILECVDELAGLAQLLYGVKISNFVDIL